MPRCIQRPLPDRSQQLIFDNETGGEIHRRFFLAPINVERDKVCLRKRQPKSLGVVAELGSATVRDDAKRLQRRLRDQRLIDYDAFFLHLNVERWTFGVRSANTVFTR